MQLTLAHHFAIFFYFNIINELALEKCDRLPMMSYNVGCFQPPAAIVLHAMFRMRMGHYIGNLTSRVSVFKYGRVSALFPLLTQ